MSLDVLGISWLLPWKTSLHRSELQGVAKEQNAAPSKGHSHSFLQFSKSIIQMSMQVESIKYKINLDDDPDSEKDCTPHEKDT